METLYRKVAVSEKLPEVSKWNIDYFLLEFDMPRKGRFVQGYVSDGLFIRTYTSGNVTVNAPFDPQPTYWLEEFPDPTAQLKADNAELLQALETVQELVTNFTADSLMLIEDVAEKTIQKIKQ